MAGEFKQPYLYGEARSAYETPMQAEIYSNSPEMESQWKQPWRADNYPKMEAEFAWPGMPQYPAPPGGWGLGADCTPEGNAIGGGSVDPCQPGVNCGQWVFTCAHRITSFAVVQSFGWIQSAVYGANDTVTVTVCWNEGDRAAGAKVGVKAIGANGQDYISQVDMDTCCPDRAVCTKTCGHCATLSIGHSTHQMTCGGSTQALTASGGGGKYVWTLFGGGSLSENHGPTTVYTPPSVAQGNNNCDNNPEITLGDCCGTKTELKIAVNCAGPGGVAYKVVLDTSTVACAITIVQRTYDCEGTFDTEIGCDGCDFSGSCPPCCASCCFWDTVACVPIAGFCCTQAAVIARCGAPTPPCATCASGTYDMRSDEQKAAGCCPEALLP